MFLSLIVLGVLAGCASSQPPRVEYVYINTPIPLTLLEKPCYPTYVEEDVRSLFLANEKNISCIYQYDSLVEGLNNYNKRLKGDSSAGFAEQ